MTENQVLRLLQKIVAEKIYMKSILEEMEELEELKTMAEPRAADPSKDHVSGGETEDLSKIIAQVEKKKSRLMKKCMIQIEIILSNETYAIDLIDLIESKETRSILIDRYFRGKSWNDIAAAHFSSRSNIFRARKAGIMEIAQKSEKTYPKNGET